MIMKEKEVTKYPRSGGMGENIPLLNKVREKERHKGQFFFVVG